MTNSQIESLKMTQNVAIEFLVFSSASRYSSILYSSSMMGMILFTSETRFGEFFVILVLESINSEHSGKNVDLSSISSLLRFLGAETPKGKLQLRLKGKSLLLCL